VLSSPHPLLPLNLPAGRSFSGVAVAAVIGPGMGLLHRRSDSTRREHSPDPEETQGADIR